jgi:restriction endonuclease Mrr
LIECKRYAEDRKVGVEIVRALYGVKTDERATKAILATTSTFSAPAKEFFAEHVWELEPRDYKGTREWIELVMQCNDLGVFGEYGSREEI